MQRLLSSLVVSTTLVVATIANAADIAKPVYKAPPAVVPAYNWTGLYIGGNLGYGWGNNTGALWDSFSDSGARIAGFDLYFAAGGNVLPGVKPTGILGGGQVGYNWQASSFVFGIAADLQAADLHDSQATSVAPPGGFVTPIFQSNDTKIDWFGTVRGRAGFAANNWLFYGTGGLAYGRVGTNVTFNCAGCIPLLIWSGTSSSTRTGWAAGGGIEVGLSPNWTIGVEYLRIDLGSNSITAVLPSGLPANAPVNSTLSADSRYSVDIVRGSISYKFDWGKTPVVAKY